MVSQPTKNVKVLFLLENATRTKRRPKLFQYGGGKTECQYSLQLLWCRLQVLFGGGNKGTLEWKEHNGLTKERYTITFSSFFFFLVVETEVYSLVM